MAERRSTDHPSGARRAAADLRAIVEATDRQSSSVKRKEAAERQAPTALVTNAPRRRQTRLLVLAAATIACVLTIALVTLAMLRTKAPNAEEATPPSAPPSANVTEVQAVAPPRAPSVPHEPTASAVKATPIATMTATAKASATPSASASKGGSAQWLEER